MEKCLLFPLCFSQEISSTSRKLYLKMHHLYRDHKITHMLLFGLKKGASMFQAFMKWGRKGFEIPFSTGQNLEISDIM